MAEATVAPQSPIHTPASCSVLQLLRAATAEQHRALEARLPLTHPDLDRETYTRVIQAYYGFHVPLQRQIERFRQPQPLDVERQKIPALFKDLQALGLNAGQINVLPQCADVPAIDTHGQLLGVMYVMEGATLGGQVLRRIIAERLAIDADNGGEFLDVYGRDTGRLWKAFLRQLAEFDHPQGCAQVVASACATFACFASWLEGQGALLSPS